MRPLTQIVCAGLFTFGVVGAAQAADADSASPIDPARFEAVTDVKLDVAFERATDEVTRRLPGLGGPSEMDCSETKVRGELVTCVVRADSGPLLAPAALAQH